MAKPDPSAHSRHSHGTAHQPAQSLSEIKSGYQNLTRELEQALRLQNPGQPATPTAAATPATPKPARTASVQPAAVQPALPPADPATPAQPQPAKPLPNVKQKPREKAAVPSSPVALPPAPLAPPPVARPAPELQSPQTPADHGDWGFAPRRTGLTTETKLGIGLVLILCVIFGAVVYKKVTDKQALALQMAETIKPANSGEGDDLQNPGGLRPAEQAPPLRPVPKQHEPEQLTFHSEQTEPGSPFSENSLDQTPKYGEPTPVARKSPPSPIQPVSGNDDPAQVKPANQQVPRPLLQPEPEPEPFVVAQGPKDESPFSEASTQEPPLTEMPNLDPAPGQQPTLEPQPEPFQSAEVPNSEPTQLEPAKNAVPMPQVEEDPFAGPQPAPEPLSQEPLTPPEFSPPVQAPPGEPMPSLTGEPFSPGAPTPAEEPFSPPPQAPGQNIPLEPEPEPFTTPEPQPAGEPFTPPAKSPEPVEQPFTAPLEQMTPEPEPVMPPQEPEPAPLTPAEEPFTTPVPEPDPTLTPPAEQAFTAPVPEPQPLAERPQPMPLQLPLQNPAPEPPASDPRLGGFEPVPAKAAPSPLPTLPPETRPNRPPVELAQQPEPAFDPFAAPPGQPPEPPPLSSEPGAEEPFAPPPVPQPQPAPLEPFPQPEPEPAPLEAFPEPQPQPTRVLPPQPAPVEPAPQPQPVAPTAVAHDGGPAGHDPAEPYYFVQPNESFWGISKKVYGSPLYYNALYAHNQKSIDDPKRLRPNTKLATPSRQVLVERYPGLTREVVAQTATTTVAKPAGEASGFFTAPDGTPAYRIGPDDTLSEIAYRHLGRSSRWVQIYQLNREVLKSPDNLKVGTVIQLPADASRVGVLNQPAPNR